MKFAVTIRIGIAGMVLLPTLAAAVDKEKNKDNAAQMVDSGSFGIFLNGHRIATETFSIQQNATGSTATSSEPSRSTTSVLSTRPGSTPSRSAASRP